MKKKCLLAPAQAAATLGEQKDAQALADFFAEVNTAYFAGRMDTLAWQEERYRQWQQLEGFLPRYLASMAAQRTNPPAA